MGYQPLAGICGLRRWSHLLLLAFGTAAVVAAGVVLSSPVRAAGDDLLADVTQPPAAAGDEAGDDPFAVSDDELAVAIFLPGFFVTVTVLMVVLAVKARVKNMDDGGSELE